MTNVQIFGTDSGSGGYSYYNHHGQGPEVFVAWCPTGQHVLGGGETNSAGTDEHLLESWPNTYDSWAVEMQNTGNVDHGVDVQAVCASVG